MIFMSWPAVIWPIRNDAAISRIANTTIAYGTRSRTDSLNTATAISQIVRIVYDARSGAARDLLDEISLRAFRGSG